MPLRARLQYALAAAAPYPASYSLGRAVLFSRSLAPVSDARLAPSHEREAPRTQLLEDEPALVAALAAYLREEGFIVASALSIATGFASVFVASSRATGARTHLQYVGSLEIDRAAHEVRRRGIRVPLTPTEFRILDMLATHVGCALSRAQLIERTKRGGDIFDRTLDRHIGNLRAKIEDDPQRPACVLTVATIGYKMVACC